MAAIDEHKDTITGEYKNVKRELDIERGNMRSEVKLARKEKRSKKHIEQLEKAVSLSCPLPTKYNTCIDSYNLLTSLPALLTFCMTYKLTKNTPMSMP